MAQIHYSIRIETTDPTEAADIAARLNGLKSEDTAARLRGLTDLAVQAQSVFANEVQAQRVGAPYRGGMLPTDATLQTVTDQMAREQVAEASQPEDVENPPAEAPRRGRPRKVAAASDTNASGAQTDTPESPVGAVSGSTATTNASPSEGDLAAALMGEEAEAEPVTAEQVAAVMKQHIDKFGAPKTMEALKAHANGATSFKSIEPAYYAAAHAGLSAELNG